MQTVDEIAFISGGNRGIGLETARELGKLRFKVVIGARDAAKASEALKLLAAEGIEADSVVYDAADSSSDARVYEHLAQRYGKLDVLVNNAGMLVESLHGSSVLSVEQKAF